MAARAWVSIVVAGGLVGALAVPIAARQAHQHAERDAESAEYPPELRKQLDEVRRATERFRDHAVAVAEGYTRFGGDGPLMGEHWTRNDLTGQPFDIAAPSTLQYLQVDGEYVLTGVAYTLYRAPGEPLPDGFVGDADEWHVHDLMKISMAATEDRPLLRWITNRRIANGRTQWEKDRPELTMVHAWTWLDNPDGVFAQDHRAIPYVRAKLPAAWGAMASVDAAYGVALLGDEGCKAEVDKVNLMAAATWRQRRELTTACEDAAARVRAAREQIDEIDLADPAVDDPDRQAGVAAAGESLNNAAETAWHGYLARRAAVLTADQLARLDVLIEHPASHGGGS